MSKTPLIYFGGKTEFSANPDETTSSLGFTKKNLTFASKTAYTTLISKQISQG